MRITTQWKLPASLKEIAQEEKPNWDSKRLLSFSEKFIKHHASKETEFISEQAIEISWKGWLGREREEATKKVPHSYGNKCIASGCKRDGVMSHSVQGGPWFCSDHFR